MIYIVLNELKQCCKEEWVKISQQQRKRVLYFSCYRWFCTKQIME